MTVIPAPADALGLCVPADLIGVPALFRSTEVTRYHLQGVCIEPLAERSGVVGVATDGHTLGAVHAAEGYAQRQIVLDIDDKAFLTACRRHSRRWLEPTTRWVCALAWPEHERDGTPATKVIELALVAWGTERPGAADVRHLLANECPDPKATMGLLARTSASWIDCHYPEWERVVPRERFHAVPAFAQGAYIERAAAVARCYSDRTAPMRIVATSEDAQSPHVIDVGFPDFLGVVMPIRHDEANRVPPVPGWLSTPTQRTADLMAQSERERETAEAAKPKPDAHPSWRDAAAANAAPKIGSNPTSERIAA